MYNMITSCIMCACMMADYGASAHSPALAHARQGRRALPGARTAQGALAPGFDPGLLTRACIYRVLPPHKYRRYLGAIFVRP